MRHGPDEWDWGGQSDRIAWRRFLWTAFWLTAAFLLAALALLWN